MTTCIVRIDKPKNSPKGTHGWQVRVGGKRGYHSKLFSDNVHGGPDKAKVEAETYLQLYLQEHPEARIKYKRRYHKGKRMGSNSSGVTGVYYTEYAHRWNKGQTVGYWCAFVPHGPKGQKRWHKKFNIDRYGRDKAKEMAIEFRQEWEKAMDQALLENSDKPIDAFFDEYHYLRRPGTKIGDEENA